MTGEVESATRIAVATLGGLAIGIERQWSGHAIGRRARFGGVRTFTLLGGTAGIAGELWNSGYGWLAALVLGGAAAIVVAGYLAASRREVDATTEVAAMVVLAAGVLASSGRLALASAIIAASAFLLVEKSRLHSFVRRIDDVEIRAGVRFAVMAAVVLPLLPEGPYGPLDAVRPRQLWTVVLVLSAVSFAGWVARRVLGARHGYAITGLIGGLVSSTSVTLAFARSSRTVPAHSAPLAVGAVAASTVMFPRLAVLSGALSPALGLEVARLLALPLAGGVAIAILGLARRPVDDRVEIAESRNPLQVLPAIELALLFQAIVLVVAWARERFGDAGLLASSALLGLADTDAVTLSIATSQGREVGAGATAIAIAALSNTLVKLGLAVGVGIPRFRLHAGLGLGCIAALTGLAILGFGAAG